MHRFFLKPIHVYCLHHVSKRFDADSMVPDDWMNLLDFQKHVLEMQRKGTRFISLSDAYNHIKFDKIRWHEYAVLTFDDGYRSLCEVVPWLTERHIPVTIFLNGKYLDGVSFRENPNERYLTKKQLDQITCPYLEIGSHGWEHTDIYKMKPQEFAESIEKNIAILSSFSGFIPFHAFTWGHYTGVGLKEVRQKNLIPVLIDGMKNYCDSLVIHRELFKI